MRVVLLLTVALFASATHDNGKQSNRYKTALSYDGWAVLGKYCMGYSSSQTGEHSVGGMNQIGSIDLKIKSKQNFENLTVLVFDDEATSWGALTQDMACADKYKHAKDFSKRKEFQVHIDPATNSWQMHRMQLNEHLFPREWYMVLARCANEKIQERNFEVEYDLHWTDEGVYDNGMGPNQCVDNGVAVSGTRVGLGVCIGISALITFLLACYVKAQRAKLKNGRGVRVEQCEDDDAAQ